MGLQRAGHQRRLFQKEKGQSNQFKSADRKVGESQDEPEPPLGERERGDSGNMERKEWTSQ